jgi:hypothetical protein
MRVFIAFSLLLLSACSKPGLVKRQLSPSHLGRYFPNRWNLCSLTSLSLTFGLQPGERMIAACCNH